MDPTLDSQEPGDFPNSFSVLDALDSLCPPSPILSPSQVAVTWSSGEIPILFESSSLENLETSLLSGPPPEDSGLVHQPAPLNPPMQLAQTLVLNAGIVSVSDPNAAWNHQGLDPNTFDGGSPANENTWPQNLIGNQGFNISSTMCSSSLHTLYTSSGLINSPLSHPRVSLGQLSSLSESGSVRFLSAPPRHGVLGHSASYTSQVGSVAGDALHRYSEAYSPTLGNHAHNGSSSSNLCLSQSISPSKTFSTLRALQFGLISSSPSGESLPESRSWRRLFFKTQGRQVPESPPVSPRPRTPASQEAPRDPVSSNLRIHSPIHANLDARSFRLPSSLAFLEYITVNFLIDQEAFRCVNPAFRISSLSPLSSAARICPMMGAVVDFEPVKLQPCLFHVSALESPPLLRRLTINGEDNRDYLTREATLVLKSNGPYAVTGMETCTVTGSTFIPGTKLFWKLEYVVDDRKSDGTGKVVSGEKTLTPLRFCCSPLLLHPLQAKRVGILHTMKKGINQKWVADKVGSYVATSKLPDGVERTSEPPTNVVQPFEPAIPTHRQRTHQRASSSGAGTVAPRFSPTASSSENRRGVGRQYPLSGHRRSPRRRTISADSRAPLVALPISTMQNVNPKELQKDQIIGRKGKGKAK